MYSLLSPSQLWHLSQSKHPPLFALARLRRTVEAVRASSLPLRGPPLASDHIRWPSLISAGPPFISPWSPVTSQVLEQHNSEGGRPSTGLELHLLSTTEAMLSAITGCARRPPSPPRGTCK